MIGCKRLAIAFVERAMGNIKLLPRTVKPTHRRAVEPSATKRLSRLTGGVRLELNPGGSGGSTAIQRWNSNSSRRLQTPFFWGGEETRPH